MCGVGSPSSSGSSTTSIARASALEDPRRKATRGAKPAALHALIRRSHVRNSRYYGSSEIPGCLYLPGMVCPVRAGVAGAFCGGGGCRGARRLPEGGFGAGP
jgi:hypothetical protein